ncbi:MAG: glycosyltransferase [Anaerolineales bacterium]|nr:glycosyltransferase [Anaerolineales bacterium]
MKFVLVGPVYPYRGGIAHYTTMLAQTLAKRGSQFHVVSFRRQYPRWLYPGKSDRDPSQKPLRVNAEYLLDPLYLWTWWQTARRIAEWKPDVAIFQWWTTFWAPAFAVLAFLLRRQGVKVMFVIHNVMPHEPRIWDRWLARLALGQGHSFLVQTGREKERLLSILPQAQTTMSPLPIYDMFAGQRIPIAKAKQRLGLPADEPVALFFGIIRPYKGLRFAIQAIAELHARDKVVNLLVAGEFWEDVTVYMQLIEQLGLSAQVKIDNRYIPDEEVGLYFSAADVFVASYIGGTQSAAVKMALGFGLPVVISKSLSSADLADETAHRLYWVDPTDVVALADAIECCLSSHFHPSNENEILAEARQKRGNEKELPASTLSDTDEWDELVTAIETAAIV